MTGVLKWTPDGVNFHPLLSGPQGPPGPAGAPGPEGGEGVEVADVPPVVPEIVLWVDPSDFQGDSGWQGFDARYVNADGDVMTAHLRMEGGWLRVVIPGSGNGVWYGQWGAGVHIQTDDESKTNPNKTIDVLRSNPATKVITLGSKDTANQNPQTVQIAGAPIQLLKPDGTAFVPTWPDHAATKGYVDGRIVVAATAPASPVTGQLWATP